MPVALYTLLLNFFVIYFLTSLLKFWHDQKERTKNEYLLGTLIVAAVSIWIGYQFPYRLSEHIWIELHLIPFVVGILYGRGKAAFVLFVMLILTQITLARWIGIFFAVDLVVALTAVGLSDIFMQFGKKKKMLLATLLGGGFAFIEILLQNRIHQVDIFTNNIWFIFPLVHIVGIPFLILFIESALTELQIKKRVLKAEKMELISHLAASISHEIRNPLTASRGFMQLVKEQRNDQKTVESYVDFAISEIDRSVQIIQDYLTFAKPSVQEIVTLDVKECLDYAIKIIQPLANMHTIDIKEDLKVSLIKGDKNLLHQCLVNLLKNAIEAMPTGGSLFVVSDKIGDKVVIVIRDTGVGMSKQQLNHLGEPYYSTKEGKGTGLGLMVVYSIVQTMSGTIYVDSEVGKGTIFTLEFPAVAQTSSDVS